MNPEIFFSIEIIVLKPPNFDTWTEHVFKYTNDLVFISLNGRQPMKLYEFVKCVVEINSAAVLVYLLYNVA
jgi:hypothetical protein